MKHVMPGLRPLSKGLPKFGQILLWLLFFAFLTPNLQAQDIPDFFRRPSNTKNDKSPKKDGMVIDAMGNAADTSKNSGVPLSFAIGLSAGTNAFIGGDVAIRIANHVNLRAGYNYLEYTFSESSVDLDGETLLFKGNLDQTNMEVLAEYAFAKDKIRIVAGAAYTFNNVMSGEGILADSLAYEDIIITPDEVGFVKGTVSFANMISPYIGIGFGKAIPSKRVGVSLDVGTYYKGSPDVMLEASNLLRNNVNNEQTIEDAMSFIKWWPVVSLRVAVKLY